MPVDGAQRLSVTLRATEGFLRSLMLGGNCRWDYTTLCKRGLGVSLGRQSCWALASGPRVESLWGGRIGASHGYTKRRTWRKLPDSIQAVVLSEASLDESGAWQMSGDGAYDKRKVYDGIKRSLDCAQLNSEGRTQAKSRESAFPGRDCHVSARPSLVPIFRPGSYRSRRWKPR